MFIINYFIYNVTIIILQKLFITIDILRDTTMLERGMHFNS